MRHDHARKRGQVTTFIIIGLVILIVTALALFIRAKLAERTLEAERPPLPPEIAPIGNYVDLCLREVIAPGVFLLGAQGGHITPPEDALLTQHAAIAYGAVDGRSTLPTMGAIESELAGFVEEAIPLCLANLTEFRQQGFVIEEGKPAAAVHVSTESVTATLDWPLTVRKGDTTYDLRAFSARVPIRLGHVLDIAGDAVAATIASPDSVDFHGLSLLDAYVSVLPYDEDTIIYTVHDAESVVDGAPFTFMFATRDSTRSTPPELDHVRDFVLRQGRPFYFQATAADSDGDYLTFYTDDPTFPIDPETGEMNITPTAPGEYLVSVGVRDTKGLADEQEVRFIVEHE